MAIRYQPISDEWTSDLALSSFGLACAMWVDKYHRPPHVLRISRQDHFPALKLVESFKGSLRDTIIREEPDFKDGEWALGDTIDQGFGSEGE